MKNFSESMEGINVQIKHLAQCLALGYLVNVSSFLGWWWRPSSLDFLPESIMCFCTSWMPSPLDLRNSFPADRCPDSGVKGAVLS